MIYVLLLTLSTLALAEQKQMDEETAVGPAFIPLVMGGVAAAKAAGVGSFVASTAMYAGIAYAHGKYGRRELAERAQTTCFEPRVNGRETFCFRVAPVPIFDLGRNVLVCCSPHMANRATTGVMSALMAYEDSMAEAAEKETAVGAAPLLVAGGVVAAKFVLVNGAKAGTAYAITRGVNTAGDRWWGRRLLNDAQFCVETTVQGEQTMCPVNSVPTMDLSTGNIVCCPPHLADKYMAELFANLVEGEMALDMDMETKVGSQAEETAVGPAPLLVAAAAAAAPAGKFVAVSAAQAIASWVITQGVNKGLDEASERADEADNSWYGRRQLGENDMTCIKAKKVKGELQCPDVLVPTLCAKTRKMACCPSDVAELYTAQFFVEQTEFEDDLVEAAVGETAVGAAPLVIGGAMVLGKFVAVNGIKAVAAYAITTGVNTAGDRATRRGRGLAEDNDMTCDASRVVEGELQCQLGLVPTLSTVTKKVSCCTPRVADRFTVKFIVDLEVALDDDETAEEQVGIPAFWTRQMLETYMHMRYRSQEEAKVGLYWWRNYQGPGYGLDRPVVDRIRAIVDKDSDDGGDDSAAEEAKVGQWWRQYATGYYGYRPYTENKVAGPSRYDPTGSESQVSGPARVDHWDDPMTMSASANSVVEGPVHKAVQPMLFVLAAVGAFTVFSAAAKCLRKNQYTQIHEPEV